MEYFLNDLQKGSDVKYEFYLENQAMLKGEFKILGASVDFIFTLIHMLWIMVMFN